jgi:hypothetical protein
MNEEVLNKYEEAIENLIKKYNGGYIGVDLDGTLAIHNEWMGELYIGAPIPKMVNRVKKWLSEGREVRIITARAEPLLETNEPDPHVIKAIEDWCLEHVGAKLMVTNQKTYGMIRLFDDRAIQVIPNTGELVGKDPL